MVTLRSLQRKRVKKNMRSKRVRTQRIRGGRPRTISQRSPSLSRSYSSIMREMENLPVVTTKPKKSETSEERKAREEKEHKNRMNFRTAMQRLFGNLKKTVKDEYVGPPHFGVKKLWTDKWSEIMNEMDSLARTLATVDGKPDLFYTKNGTMGYKMKELKDIHEEYMNKPTGASKRTKKKGRKKTKGKKKNKTKGKRKTRGKRFTKKGGSPGQGEAYASQRLRDQFKQARDAEAAREEEMRKKEEERKRNKYYRKALESFNKLKIYIQKAKDSRFTGGYATVSSENTLEDVRKIMKEIAMNFYDVEDPYERAGISGALDGLIDEEKFLVEYEFTCPEGAEQGDHLGIELGGSEYDIVVPKGVKEGEEFIVVGSEFAPHVPNV